MDTPGGTVDVPKIGRVKKVYVWGAIGGVGLYVAWRWYSSAGTAATDTTTTDSGDDTMSPTGIVGDAVGGNYQYAGTTTDGTTAAIGTDAQWVNDAVDKLSGTAGWDAGAVYQALGDYITQRPLTDAEQTIVRAAIAASGYPPGGQYAIIPQVGPVTLTAPTNVKASNVTGNSVTLSFDRVSGAGYYRVYRSGASTNVGAGDGPPIQVTGLEPNTTYTFYVAADTTSGKPGPRSSGVKVKTTGAKLSAPGGLAVRAASRTAVQVKWNAVAGAGGYMLQRSGGPTWESTDTADTVSGLKPNTSYKVRVAALQPGTRTPGPWSAYKTIRTTK